jgi:hypothetical protein
VISLSRLALAAALVSCTATAALSAAAEPTGSVVRGPLAGTVAPVVDLETKLADHLQQGTVVPIRFGSAAQTPGDVVSTGGWGDSGLWSGVYLGGEAMRYATARHYLSLGAPGRSGGKGGADDAPGHRGLTDEERAFWTAQRDQALERVRAVLQSEHININISASWKGAFHPPTVDPAGYPLGGNRHLADFGGGLVDGQAGMLQRACTPTSAYPLGVNPPTVDPADPTRNNENRVYEITWRVEDGGDGRTYWCETSPSRDTYAGVTFGMLTAFDLVSQDFPQMRAQIARDVIAMGDFLVKYGWSYPRPHGYVSADHDFDGFVSPLFVYTPLARLNVANTVRHVADLAGTAADKQKWDAVWAEELASQGPMLEEANTVGLQQPNEGYYGMNLNHLNTFNLARTTTGAERDLVLRGFSPVYKTTQDDVNAHFEAIVFSMTGDRGRLSLALQHLGQWLDYRRDSWGGAYVRNSTRCGTEIRCVPKDQYEIAVDQAPGGSVTWFPGQPDLPPVSEQQGLRAARPLPVGVRPPTDFLWQRTPTDLDGHEDAAAREPGIDYLTPYWMLRYFTEVVTPPQTPMPTYLGPAYY